MKILAAPIAAVVLSGCLVHPMEVYEAPVSGTVFNQTNTPLAGASVKRVAEVQSKGKYGEMIFTRVYSDQVMTNQNGQYLLPAKQRRKLFKTPMDYMKPWVFCFAYIEVSANGYATYVSKFRDEDLYFDNRAGWACNGVTFVKDIALTEIKFTATDKQ